MVLNPKSPPAQPYGTPHPHTPPVMEKLRIFHSNSGSAAQSQDENAMECSLNSMQHHTAQSPPPGRLSLIYAPGKPFYGSNTPSLSGHAFRKLVRARDSTHLKYLLRTWHKTAGWSCHALQPDTNTSSASPPLIA